MSTTTSATKATSPTYYPVAYNKHDTISSPLITLKQSSNQCIPPCPTHEILIHLLKRSQSRCDIDQHRPPDRTRMIEDHPVSHSSSSVVGDDVEAGDSYAVPMKFGGRLGVGGEREAEWGGRW